MAGAARKNTILACTLLAGAAGQTYFRPAVRGRRAHPRAWRCASAWPSTGHAGAIREIRARHVRDRAPARKPDHRDAARQAAFRRAVNHSRRVRILKLALPTAALAIA